MQEEELQKTALVSTLMPPRLQVHTGIRIPSSIVAEVDSKIDDGNSNTGGMLFNKYDPTGNTQVLPVGDCTSVPNSARTNFVAGTFTTAVVAVWRHAQATPTLWQNCGAGVFI